MTMPKSSKKLLDDLQKALSRKQSRKDLLEQRVSFVYGSLSAKSGVTREKVKEILRKQEDLAA